MRGVLLRTLAALLLPAAIAVPVLAETPPGTVPFEMQLLPARGAPRATTAWERDGVLFLPAEEIALLLDATLHWRSELGRVTLSADKHEMMVTCGSDVALIDATGILHLPGSAFLWEGGLMVPLDLVVDAAGAARPWVGKPVRFSRERRRLAAIDPQGQVVDAAIASDLPGWRLNLLTDVDPRYEIVTAERSSFVVLLRGVVYDPLLLPLPTAHEAFQGLYLRSLPEGLELSFTPLAAARGYRVEVSGRRFSLLLGLDERDVREGRLRPFAAPLPAGERIRLAALDPGHGVREPGATIPGGIESELTLDICRRIASRLRDELGTEAVLTRGEDENPSAGDRSRRAAEHDAEVFISIHMHDRKGGPAAFVAETVQEEQPGAALTALGFRSLRGSQTPYLASSRLLARSVMDGVAAALGDEPRGVFAEALPELTGTDRPAMLLELGLGDDDRRWDDAEREKVAAGVVEGLRFYLLGGRQDALEEDWR